MASPVSRLDILLGYLLGFLLFAMVQTLILFFYAVYVLKAEFHGRVVADHRVPDLDRDAGGLSRHLHFGFRPK